MKQYQGLLQDILTNGVWKAPAREGMPRTKSIFSRQLRFNLQEGFPAVTIKKLYWKGVVGELLWFLRGDTNIKYLVDNNINIWNADAYKYYKNNKGTIDGLENFVKEVKTSTILYNEPKLPNTRYRHLGDLGSVYGAQWREWDSSSVFGGVDQIKILIQNLVNNPDGRYAKVTAWNPTDFLQYPDHAALPACHTDFQCYVRPGVDSGGVDRIFLDLDMNQRSCDTFLGVPFNIASYALLTNIIADLVGMTPGELIWNGKDIHIYENHQEQVNEALSREPLKLPWLDMSVNYYEQVKNFREGLITLDEFLNNIEISDFMLKNYTSHEAIKAELSVGK